MTERDSKILIVDDEPDNAELIELHLEQLGYKTVSVLSGESAITRLEDTPESWLLVLLDRKMPGIDGIEVATYIGKNAKLKYLPIIMQTACASREELKEGIDAGVYHYLTKPFTGEMLRSVVRSALQLRFKYERACHKARKFDQTCDLVQSAKLEFRTLDEGSLLATQIASQFDNRDETALGLNEIFTNAIEHGNLEISFDQKTELIATGRWEEEVNRRLQLPSYRNRTVELSIEKQPKRTVITIKDQGNGFDWEPYLDLSASRIFHNHGRGIAIANMKCFDNIQFLGCGNEVRVEIPQATRARHEIKEESPSVEAEEPAPA